MTLRRQDHTHKWRDKADRNRRLDSEARARFQFDTTDLETVLFLFPEAEPTLFSKLDREISREVRQAQATPAKLVRRTPATATTPKRSR